jgi:predicted membrane channel-forming protein YqfA (hemolysin III family)
LELASHRYWKLEEILNSATHGVGLALSAAGMVVLVVMAAHHGTAWHIVSCAIYGVSLILLYGASMLYPLSAEAPPARLGRAHPPPIRKPRAELFRTGSCREVQRRPRP